MLSKIANEFENITKFGLLQYFTDYRDFLQDDYSEIYSYYSGKSEEIDANKINKLKNLISRGNDLIRTFQTFAGKLGNVGYWELQQYCEDLKDTLERIAKLPKYCRTAKSRRGYKACVQVSQNIGGMLTVEDVAEKLGNIEAKDLILNNDLEEEDYEIDELSQITAFVDNNVDVVVTSIMEQPIGVKIYGRDINRKITFEDNDLSLVEFEDNIEQKCDILIELNKGDVPENLNFGKNYVSGKNYSNINYAELLTDIQNNFLQNDLFESVSVTDIQVNDGSIFMVCDIKTKYTYSTTKSVKL